MDSRGYQALEKAIVKNSKFRFTLASYLIVLVFYINLNIMQSFVIGLLSFFVYFLINGAFLAHVFFENEAPLFRAVLGVLMLIILLGFVGWFVMIIYNLGTELFSITLLVAATVSSLLNLRIKRQRNVSD